MAPAVYLELLAAPPICEVESGRRSAARPRGGGFRRPGSAAPSRPGAAGFVAAALVAGYAAVALLAGFWSHAPGDVASSRPSFFVAVTSTAASGAARAAWRGSCCARAYAAANISWRFYVGVPQSKGHALTAHIQSDQATEQEKRIEAAMLNESRAHHDLEVLAMRDVPADETGKLLATLRHVYETTMADYVAWHGDWACADPSVLLPAVLQYEATAGACLGEHAGHCEGSAPLSFLVKKGGKENGDGAHFSAERYVHPGVPPNGTTVVGSPPAAGGTVKLLYGGAALRLGDGGEFSKDGTIAPYFTDEFVVVNRPVLLYIAWRDWAHSLFWSSFGSGIAASDLGKVIARCVDRLGESERLALTMYTFPTKLVGHAAEATAPGCQVP